MATTGFDDIDQVIADRRAEWVEELIEFCAIGSETGEAKELEEAAAWTADRLRRLGADVDILRSGTVPPLVAGDIGEGSRTLIAVQHYDVQPAEPLDLWTTPPYAPSVRDGRLFARGATDNKGEFLPRVWAVQAWLEARGSLPCRVRFLVEGEEESGSPTLASLLDQRPELRVADGALIEGGGLDPQGRPEICGGGRGMVLLNLTVRTLAYDAHSSGSMLLPNAAVRMAQAISSLVDADGLPAVPGLNVGALAPTAAQLAVVDAQPLDELAELKRSFAIDRFLAGRDGIEALRAETFEPTLNVQALWSGHLGASSKTITPAEAHARIDIRLVPNQDPGEVAAAVRRRLDAAGFGDVEVRIGDSERAWWTAPDHPLLRVAAEASEETVARPAIVSVAMSGTVPMYEVCAAHNVPATLLGAARIDCRAHAPDENIWLDDLVTATRITTRFLPRFAAISD